MALMTRSTHDPKLTRWWWHTLREWVYELIDPLWGAFRGENTDDIALANVTGINDVSASELAVLDGLTATNTELNKLSGLTADASELNKADRTAADGTAEASRNVVLDANKDILGKRYDINQSLLGAVVNGSFMRFDGEDDVVTAEDASDILDFGTADFSVVAIVRRGGSSYSEIVGRGLYGQSAMWGLGFTDTGMAVQVWSAGAAIANFMHTFVEGCIYSLGFKRVGDTITGHVNGSALTPVTEPYFAGDLGSSGKPLRLGRYRYTTTNYCEDHIFDVKIFNRALSDDEVKALASGAPVDFADVGANQTDLVTNGEDWTGATGSTPPNNWSDTGAGTATYIIRDNTPVANFGDDKALEINASGGSKTLYQSVAQVGKRYRVSFVYRNLDGSSSSYVALGSSDNKVTLQNTGISGDGIVFEQELLADGTDLKFFIDTDGTLQIDHVEVIQIGCVAAYLPEGITHAQWQDASGNELHGSVNGAIPLNLPSGHVARYIKQGITGDTTLSAAVPAGYRIKSMVADVSGAGAGMRLNIGTSAGGTDVVNNQDISSNGLFDLPVAKNIFSLSSAQSLYVNDDGGTAWSGVSVDLYIDLERVR